MKKIFSLVALLALCSLPMWATKNSENPWVPSEDYARWCREFHFDKVWEFSDDGSATNNPTEPNDHVGLEECPGMLAFSIMSWKDRPGKGQDDYGLDTLGLYLYDGYAGKLYKICQIHFSGDHGSEDTHANIYAHEGNVTKIVNANNNKTWCVQKRMNAAYQGNWGAQFCYFVTEYDQSLVDFANSCTPGRLQLLINCRWDNMKWEVYMLQTSRSLTTLPQQRLSAPEMDVPYWKNINGQTSLISYTRNDNLNSDVKVILKNLSSGNAINLDAIRCMYRKDTIAISRLGTVTNQLLEDDNLQLSSQVIKTYNITQAHWKIAPDKLAIPPHQLTYYSAVTTQDVPKMMQPANLRVENNNDGVNILKWTMKKPTNTNIDGSRVIAERSYRQDFRTIDAYQVYNYNSNITDYSWNDKYSERGRDNMTLYYRIYRENTGINDPAHQLSYATPTNYVKVEDLTARQEKGQALVTWKLSPSGLWTAGMRVRLSYDNQTIYFPRDSTQTRLTLKPCTPTHIMVEVTDNGERKSMQEKDIVLQDTFPSSLHTTVSKGFYNDHVDVEWTVPKDSAHFTYFNVERIDLRDLGLNGKWTSLGTVNFTAGILSYHYQDYSCVPGIYYMYRVSGFSLCNGVPYPENDDQQVGFAQPYGVVTGQVHYGSNQGVQGVKISAIGETARRGRSLHLISLDSTQVSRLVETGEIKHWTSYATTEAHHNKNAGTIEVWVKKMTNVQLPVFLHNDFRLYITPDNKFKIECQGDGVYKSKTDATVLNLSDKYHAVALTYNCHDGMVYCKVYLDGQYVFSYDESFNYWYYPNWATYMYFGSDVTDQDAQLDEIRMWDVELSESAIASRSNHHLTIEEQQAEHLKYYECRQPLTREDLIWCSQQSYVEWNHIFANKMLGQNAGAIEMWLHPIISNSDLVVVHQKNNLDWRITAQQQMQVTMLNKENLRLTVNLQDSTSHWQNYQFNHVAMSYKVQGDSLHMQLLINGHIAASKLVTATNYAHDVYSNHKIQLGSDGKNNYNGYVDEIRFWSIYRDSMAINQTMDGYLSGSEFGLTGYYRCDDENTGELYDISKTNSSFNCRHAQMINAQLDENNIPTKEQLSLSARTDLNGNYILNAVPYSAEGSLYSIVPSLGTHVFSPTNTPLFFDKSASTHNSINFTDNSAFEVSGYVTYKNTNYPVEGCMFSVDGVNCTNGTEIVKTNANGYYKIYVPIGKHVITITKEGHTFADNGHFPKAIEGNTEITFDFQKPKNDLNFTDLTLVTLTGRVAGGEQQDSLPHGLQQGKNNIGKARVVISPLTKGKYDLNMDTANRVWTIPQGCAVQSKATTGKPLTDAGRYIVVETDPVTGEFSVELPPIDMSVDSITIPSNPVATQTLSPSSYGTIQLSDFRETSWHKDSVKTEQGTQYFSYNKALDIIYRVKPYLEVKDDARTDNMFGMTQTVGYNRLKDTTVIIPLIVYDSLTQKSRYVYDYPFLQQNNTYQLNLFCYEKYTNADNPADIKEDKVAVRNSLVIVYNGAGESLSGSNSVVLNNEGMGSYSFSAGDPNIMPSDSLTKQYHRSFSISYTDSKQEAYYNWDMNKNASCIVLGAVNIDGQNFITEGPNELLYILRDPPGSKSFATLKAGTKMSNTYTVSTSRDNSGGGEVFLSFGPKLEIAKGFGIMSISELKSKDVLSISPTGGTGQTNQNKSQITYTFTRDISTGTDEWFDGASGDIYIGLSTNFNYGNVKHLGFNYDDTKKEYLLSVTDKTAISKEYNTDFALSQYQLENVQLPNMIRQRNELIRVVSPEVYDHYEDSVKRDKKEMKYISKIPKTDPRFGQEGYYIAIYPTDIPNVDRVNFYNEQVASWKRIMAKNEEVKVKAIEQKEYKYHKNLSVDGGMKYSESAQCDSALATIYTDNSHFNLSIYDQLGGYVNNVGMTIKGQYSHTWQKNENWDRESAETKTLSYTFDLVTNEQLSVDIYEGADAFSPIFFTSAGQTECPYEGEVVTKYFQPGQHVISTATQKLADPDIEIDGSATVSGVPVGGKAVFTVKLMNKSTTTTYTYLRFKQASGTNPYGAEIKVDGSPLTEAGIPMKIDPQTTIVKTITLTQSNLNYMDYDKIGLIWCSDCSPVITADTTYISAHFVAACPAVELSLQKSVVNTQDKQLSMTFSGYDVNSPTLRKIILQYKQASDPVFRYQIAEFTVDTLKTSPQVFTYQWDMSALLDGVYDVRVVTECEIGSERIQGEGNYFTITKDTSAPVALGLPSPVNGIYTNDDEIYVLMNEPIQTAKVMPANVSVTGMLNAHDVSQHDVAFHYTDQVSGYTESQVYVSSKAFSLEMWLRYQKPGTVFYHGKKDGMWVYINEAGYLEVGMPTDSVVSKIQVPKDTWCFLLMTMQNTTDSTCQVSLHLAYNDKDLKDDFILPTYAKTAPILVGYDGEGDIHEMMMTPTARTWETASIERNQSKDLYTDAIGYWPMNEGYGQTAKDQLRHRNLVLSGESWCLNGENYAKHVNKPLTVPVNTATVNNDYAIEMWLRQYGDGEIFRTSDTTMGLGSKAGQLVMTIGSDTIKQTAKTNLSDGGWHQLTFLGNKSGKAVCIVDGSRMEFANAALLPNLLTKALVFGATDSLDLDELRVWKSDMSESWLELNRYCQLGADAMTKYNGRLSIYQSMNDVAEAERAMSAAPLRQPRLQSKVNHTITTSDEVLLINITEPAYRIEGCTLEFCASGLIDANGNYSSPITWTAYVNRNQLLWSEREVNITKENLAAATFKVDIVNNSGKQENWQLSNIPEWLTFSETSGTIQPLSEYHLMATIDPSLAIGTYEPVIYLTGSQSIKAPLYLNVKVTGDEPDWQINTADFEYTMNMIAVATLNGFAIDDEEDKVAAFVNGQLAGVASPKYNKTYYQFFVMMDIYANLTQEQKDSLNSGEAIKLPVTFKLWDASTGLVYTQIQPLINGVVSTINFAPNSMVGTIASPVVLAAGNKVEQSIALEKGWNWVSFNVLDENTPLNDFLRAFISDITIIKSQTEYAQVDSVRQVLMGSLRTMNAIKSYQLNSNRATADVVVGYPVNPMMAGIKLSAKRWTWIGYIPQMSLSVNAAMANLTPTVGDIIKGRKGFATWDGAQWIGSLAAMVPGQGYMYYNASATAQTLYYPTNLAIADYAPIRRLTSYSEAVFSPVDPGQYQNNMTITARVMDGDEVVTDAEVGVFADEECRANAFANEGLYFLTIPGEQSVSLTFKVARGAEIITPEQGITYMTDAVVGDLYAPYIIQIGEASGLKATSDGLQATGVQKVLINEQVYIIRDGKKTSVLGQEVK